MASSTRWRISSMSQPWHGRSTVCGRTQRWAWTASPRTSTGQDLAGNLRDLHARLKAQRYRHQPIRRVHVPKDQGRTRPLGIAAFEDKVVQDALRAVLQAVYEQDFLDCSYGFRPGRSAHDAVRALHQVADKGEMNCVLEADIRSFFDCVDRTALLEMLQERVADGSLL